MGGRKAMAEGILEEARKAGVMEKVGADEGWSVKLVTEAMNNLLKRENKKRRAADLETVYGRASGLV
eukprot:7386154-Prymnesium_polylepis.1